MENKRKKKKRDVTMSNITPCDRDSVGERHKQKGIHVCSPRETTASRALSHSTNRPQSVHIHFTNMFTWLIRDIESVTQLTVK